MDEIRFSRSQFLARLALRRPTLLGSAVAEFEELDTEALAQAVEQVLGVDGAETPPDLSELSAEYDDDGQLVGGDLFDLRSQLATGYAAARSNVETDEQVEALRMIAAALARIDGESTGRLEAIAQREAELAELDAAVNGPGDGDGSEDEGDGEETGTGDGGTGVGDDTTDAAPEAEPVGAAAQAATRPPAVRRPSLSSLRGSQARAPQVDDTPAPTGIALRGRVMAGSDAGDVAGRAFADAGQLGQAIDRMVTELRVPNPGERKYYLGRLALPERPGVVLQSEFAGEDSSLLDEAVRRHRELTMDDNRKVAAGGVCVPAQPDYAITVVGDRGQAWVDSLPGVQGNRPISFFRWINLSLRDTAGSRVGARPASGYGTVSAAEDAAGYGDPLAEGGSTVPEGGHAFKDCVRIDCPSPISEVPLGRFRCTTVGNFAAMTWPEYVRAFDEIVGFYFDVYRDEQALATIVAAAKTLNVADGPTFGAVRDLLDAMRRLVAHVRSVRKAPNMAFRFDVPAFARYMIAQDIADSWATTNEGLRLTPAQALALLSMDEGITIGEYGVSIGATGDGSATVLPELTDGTDLPDWPTQIRILAYPDGALWRHDYGELSFGVRETGLATNDMSGFYEIMESVNYRTTDIFTLDVPLCVNGAAGAAVAKLCGAESA